MITVKVPFSLKQGVVTSTKQLYLNMLYWLYSHTRTSLYIALNAHYITHKTCDWINKLTLYKAKMFIEDFLAIVSVIISYYRDAQLEARGPNMVPKRVTSGPRSRIKSRRNFI